MSHLVCRLESLKAAADASGRKLAIIGASLYQHAIAARKCGMLTFEVSSLVGEEQVEQYDPNELLIVCTGS